MVLSTMTIIIGALFKIQHYPYAGIMLSAGCIGLALVYLADFIISETRHRKRR